MDGLIQKLKALSSANEFLEFFGVEYDEAVVHVNRLHILKRFYQYLHKSEGLSGLGEIEMFKRYRELLAQAYEDFVQSTPAREKVFKVFQDADGSRSVSVTSLRGSRVERPRETSSAA